MPAHAKTAGNAGGAIDHAASAGRAIWPHLLFAFLLSGAVNALFLASPLYMMQLYGRVLNSRSVETLVSVSIALGLALVLMGAADAARGRLLARAAGRMASRLSAPVARMSLAEGRGRAAADLGEVETLRKFLGGGAVATLMDAPFTLIFLLILFLLHPLLGLCATLGAVAILLVIGAARLIEARRERRIAALSAASEAFGSTLASDRGEIRGLGLVDGLAARLALDGETIGRLRLASGDATASVGATTRTLRLAAHSGVLAAGAALAIEGALGPSAMLAAAILAGRALGPIEALPAALRTARRARDAAGRLEQRLEHRLGEAAKPPAAPRERARTGATVEARRLVVAVPGSARAALRSVSFRVEAGEVVSIAGPSGAGKSTLLRCLAGAEPVRSGELRIAGLEFGPVAGPGGGPVVGWLPQDAPIFPGTVHDNIARFGDASEAEVRQAALRAGALPAIERLPRGFATALDPGGASPSLRQAIGFARALLPEPELLLLDQPTAHLDAEGEVAAMNAIRALKGARVTILIVSHKPVLATLADRIMLLRDGAIEVFEDREVVLNAIRRRSLRPVATESEAAESDATGATS